MSQIDLGAWRESGPSWALVYGWQLSITAEQERTQHMAKCHLPAAGQLQSCTFGPRLGQSGELGCCFFLLSHLQGPLPPGACDSLLARNSGRVEAVLSPSSTFSPTCTLALSGLQEGQITRHLVNLQLFCLEARQTSPS